MQTVAIAGVGLIGGSFGLALRKYGFTGELLGVSSPATIEAATKVGAIDRGVSLEEAAERADLIYLAQPISGILSTLEKLKPLARPDCLITDAGSTKAEIVRRAEGIPAFLGGHPMAGKESRGASAADPDLFRGRPYVFTVGNGTELHPSAAAFVKQMSLCGAVPIFLAPEEHDRIVAFTSHVPQLASTALACVAGSELTEDQALAVSGPGFRDMTRLALSSWDIWSDILQSNSGFIRHALSVYIDKLTELRDNLQTQRAGEIFTAGAEAARKVRQQVGH